RSQILIVVSQRAREVRDTVAGAPGVSRIVIAGDSVRLAVDDAQLRAAQIGDRLASEKIAFDEIAAGEPTIEDLFVASMGNGDPNDAR
ncbi:MAG TPA: hypothetical protein VMT58_00290, partial [Candidatus Binataceae bacterium]|nr:hypothetical protein [Candidatus Binataceae bacterium]